MKNVLAKMKIGKKKRLKSCTFQNHFHNNI